MNASQFPPGTPDDVIARHNAREAILAAAHSAPLPGALRDAFASDPPRFKQFTLQPVTAGLVAFMERIQSPFLAVFRLSGELMGKGQDEIAARVAEIQCDPEQTFESLLCFVMPIRELRKLLNAGRPEFRRVACETVGDVLNPVEARTLEKICGLHFSACACTWIEYATKPEAGPGFTPPPPPPATGSAGGSTSSDS